jgi:hypothetical protein
MAGSKKAVNIAGIKIKRNIPNLLNSLDLVSRV